ETNRLLELERQDRLGRARHVGRALVRTLTDKLSFVNVERVEHTLAELHRLRRGQLRNRGPMLDLLQERVKDLIGNIDQASCNSGSHNGPSLFVRIALEHLLRESAQRVRLQVLVALAAPLGR